MTDPDLLAYMENERNRHRIEYALSYLNAVESTHTDAPTRQIVHDLRTILGGDA